MESGIPHHGVKIRKAPVARMIVGRDIPATDLTALFVSWLLFMTSSQRLKKHIEIAGYSEG
jgi:hypothetical protein